MEQLEHKAPKKKRTPRLAVIALAAALLVGSLLCMAADIPDKFYDLITGGTFVLRTAEGYGFIDRSGLGYEYADRLKGSPVVLEDGRLMLTVDGETTDITGLVDENTPYIVESEPDPESGFWSCLIIGGTPENFGWVEGVVGSNYDGNDDHLQIAQGINYYYNLIEMPDGSMVTLYDLTGGLAHNFDEPTTGFDFTPYLRTDDLDPNYPDVNGYLPGQTVNYPWLDAAIAQVDFRWG